VFIGAGQDHIMFISTGKDSSSAEYLIIDDWQKTAADDSMFEHPSFIICNALITFYSLVYAR
jgi:hypothetical protein